MRVLIFGASITQGFYDTEGGWVNRLRKHYDELQIQDLKNNHYPTVFNLGISGDNTTGLLRRFKSETEARIWPDEEFLFVFSIGTNNALERNGVAASSPTEYANDLKKIVDQARGYSNKIMMVGLPCCDEALTRPVAWEPNISYTNDNIRGIDNAMRDLCSHESIPYVHIFEAFQKELAAGNNILSDGLHPNNEGHQLILDLVMPTIEKVAA